ncbi:hypothetical protein TSOC_012375 [Tetrabaena socialis]|uniref:Uncharacterized protein n=1 Tax=Tetrabaena socialis TaxID=47790 RepID=A0A2J7ZN97_9CHLO|nr:hypothetical protein TSOC_012375 [Tetrabaena socialis]|eukprot:PNH01727.1 hypothetical protein TSOC_012375 [Tetrabaena socialis]
MVLHGSPSRVVNKYAAVLRSLPHDSLYEYDLDARMLRRLDLSWLRDTEDVTYVSYGRVAVVEEPPGGGIRVLDVSEAGGGRQLDFIPTTNSRTSANGNEGLSYDPRSGAFIVAQEKGPKRIISVRPTANGGGGWSTLVNGDESFSGLGDLSAVEFVPQLDQLFVLSQESSRLLRTTMDGRVLQQMSVVGSQPEGLAFSPDGVTLFVVSEVSALRPRKHSLTGLNCSSHAQRAAAARI